MDNWTSPITWLAGGMTLFLAGLVGLVLRTRMSIANHKLYAAETFATKPDLEASEARVMRVITSSEGRIMTVLTRVEGKLDKHVEDQNGKH